MIVLGIETSCDETAASILKGPREILSNVISSQMELHHAYGGVVPEMASRRHVEVIDIVVRESIKKAKIDLSQIDLIAVTVGPGLVGSLLIGATFAKTLAHALHKPCMGINHLEGHLYAPMLENLDLEFPWVSLIVSGGHTLLVWVKAIGQYEILGSTFDDAAGEAYDKVAKLLGLGYPGGPIIDQLAREGDPKAVKLPKPYLSKTSMDFSFSGLKTAVLYSVKGYGRNKNTPVHLEDKALKNLAASFQASVVDVLTEKCLRALNHTGASRLAIGGGVAANSRLREHLKEFAQEKGFEVFLPSKAMCTDNAAMIASLGWATYNAGLQGEVLEVNPKLRIREDQKILI